MNMKPSEILAAIRTGEINVDGTTYQIDEVEYADSLVINMRLVPKSEMVDIVVLPDKCDDAWEDEDSFGYGHECRLPKGHKGDHVCAYQDDDQDFCRWKNCADTPDTG